ncbi:hypothetical protein EWM64_g2524 [Hericium alpestre]|uniref:BRCA2 OB1 domain-containing protein n=1 Tax=Hericium alpestre TaxID=135208 RepID=A0A4Z0A388_9AGAM|nr:hypothetical protein EWM64_g2524 [Hericium alpestre]
MVWGAFWAPPHKQVRPVSTTDEADTHDRSQSPEEPPEKDYSSWFTSTAAPAPATIGFAAASTVALPDVPIAAIGFVTANKSKVFAPSETAWQQAQARMKLWETEDTLALTPLSPPDSPKPSVSRQMPIPTSPSRPVLSPVENALPQLPLAEAPTPARVGFSSAGVGGGRAAFQTPSVTDIKGKGKAAVPFKSPLVRAPAVTPFKPPSYVNSPLNLTRPQMAAAPSAFTPARSVRPPVPSTPGPAHAQLTAVETPIRQAAFSTPPRPVGMTPARARAGPKKFVTPFKPGMRPGETGRAQLEEKYKQERAAAASTVVITSATSTASPVRVAGRTGPSRRKFFDLKPPPNRKTLASSGLMPHSYTAEELTIMSINVDELKQITPETAIYYAFHSPGLESSSGLPVPNSTKDIYGAEAALEVLKELGCSLATKEWVDNHWRLILWKLAALMCLEPERETRDETKRWCWGEVIRQLRYRYEKEVNGGSRPPLRLITTHDTPAACPMVLCVSNIIWPELGDGDEGLTVVPHPELEVTDGWYRLRAQIDAPLARARILTYLHQISTQRSDPSEVLEAYSSCQLTICGNSTHLAPWHAKLGFQPKLSISTLNSLTPDGGAVQMMDLVVTKAYPIAFLEFVEKNGKKRREGPRKEAEEMAIQEQWEKRRAKDEAKLRSHFEEKMDIYEEWALRLERRSASHFYPTENDSPPDNIEDIFDELDGGTEFSKATMQTTINEAGWLARFVRERITQEREKIDEEIERDLKHICPPREVRNFRVLFMKDARTERRPAHRTVEITVWDVLNLSFDEGRKPGSFAEGQRFLVRHFYLTQYLLLIGSGQVTNLLPSQASAWMPPNKEDSHVYLSTRRDSKWTRIRSCPEEAVRT